MGTATTFDAVNPAGQFVGGAIARGIQVSLEALGVRGAQLRQVELTTPRSVIAKNTVEALQAGSVFGFASQVDGVVARMLAELDLAGVVAAGRDDGLVGEPGDRSLHQRDCVRALAGAGGTPGDLRPQPGLAGADQRDEHRPMSETDCPSHEPVS